MAKAVHQDDQANNEKYHRALLDLKSEISKTRLFFLTLFLCIMASNFWLLTQQRTANIDSDTGKLQQQVETLQAKLHEAKTQPVDDRLREIMYMFSLPYILERAQKTKPTIHFASNQTRAKIVARVAKSITAFNIYTCENIDLPNKFDAYRNCFRDLAIEFHNRLSMQIDNSHWFTSVGRVQYSFLITTMVSKRNEYLISVGDIVFQALEYPHLITTAPEHLESEPAEELDNEDFKTVQEALDRYNLTKLAEMKTKEELENGKQEL